MLGYVTVAGPGAADALLRAVAARLETAGVALAGAVQSSAEVAQGKPHMDLRILPDGPVVRISQSLGALSAGCRLDPGGLERAVALVERALETHPQLLIVNKFGKQEVEGRGFRPVIGAALTAGIPVLVAVSRDNLAGFRAFAEDMAEALPPETGAVLDWCRGQIAG